VFFDPAKRVAGGRALSKPLGYPGLTEAQETFVPQEISVEIVIEQINLRFFSL